MAVYAVFYPIVRVMFGFHHLRGIQRLPMDGAKSAFVDLVLSHADLFPPEIGRSSPHSRGELGFHAALRLSTQAQCEVRGRDPTHGHSLAIVAARSLPGLLVAT